MTSPSSHPFGYPQPTNSSLGMGTLGLSQNPRNLGGQQFPGRISGNNSHMSGGHVTPTSSGLGSFPPILSNNMAPQQSSPNSRSMLPMGSRGITSQRPLNQDMKRIVGLTGSLGGLPTPDEGYNKRDRNVMFNIGSNAMSSMASYGLSQRSFATQNMLSSGIQSSTFSTSPALDLSEFPSLTNRSTQDNSNPSVAHNPMAGRPQYVGMVKQPTNESSEFQIHSEDFPALPGSQSQENSQDMNKSSSGNSLESSKEQSRYMGDKSNSQSQKRGIQTSKDGRVTNIPPGMVTDQFGMVGLLTFIRAAETDPKLVSLALGSDLTTLGLNLNTPENLYPSFGGPWSEQPCRPQDIDYHVPAEYLVNQTIRDKLAPVKLNRYGEDLLFFLFYMFSGDILQVAAAIELYNRDWRFHKDERVWITRVPGMAPAEKTATYERGMYYFFDADNWRKVAKEFHLDYDRLEERALMPPQFAYHSTQSMSA